MGAWGDEPWDNDAAADWFGSLWDGVPIVDRVLTALDVSSGDENFAALWLCTELCRVYVWPVDRIEETLRHAVAAADRLLAREDENGLLDLWDDAELEARVVSYRQTLVDRQR